MAHTEWSIRYSDGSANVYRFWHDGDGAHFEYTPVTPDQSSTGMYSGGAVRGGGLPAAASEMLWRQVRELEAARALHVADRAKRTGAFAVSDHAGTREFIIQESVELSTFDAFAAGLG